MNVKYLNFNSENDVFLLENFLAKNNNPCFRYFQNRPLSVIKNHMYTCLYFTENTPIGYGHLDKENNKIWLGILVDKNFRNKSFGTKIVTHLTSLCKEDIHLSVDKENAPGLHLYKKFGFCVVDCTKNAVIMTLTKH